MSCIRQQIQSGHSGLQLYFFFFYPTRSWRKWWLYLSLMKALTEPGQRSYWNTSSTAKDGRWLVEHIHKLNTWKPNNSERSALKALNVCLNNMTYLDCTFSINSSIWGLLCFWHIRLNIQYHGYMVLHAPSTTTPLSLHCKYIFKSEFKLIFISCYWLVGVRFIQC